MVNCKYCKRELKNPISIERQAGLSCAKKHGMIKINAKKEYKYKEMFKDGA